MSQKVTLINEKMQKSPNDHPDQRVLNTDCHWKNHQTCCVGAHQSNDQCHVQGPKQVVLQVNLDFQNIYHSTFVHNEMESGCEWRCNRPHTRCWIWSNPDNSMCHLIACNRCRWSLMCSIHVRIVWQEYFVFVPSIHSRNCFVSDQRINYISI